MCGRFHGFGKPARFGIGGRQRVEEDRHAAVGEPDRFLGQFDGLLPVSDRCLGNSRPQPCQIVVGQGVERGAFYGAGPEGFAVHAKR